jgi:glycosyltransferase involved in cell wall biosynthesis
MVDYGAAQNVDQYVANSKEVKARIQKFYRRDAAVIYPPVELPKLVKSKEVEKYYLTGGRLARAKHVDVIIKACTQAKLPLKVFGKAFAGYGEELRKLSGDTISFVGEINDEEKYQLMQGATAFLFASEDEDFGITPVESMALGTPVIAYRSGGVKETIIENKTGLFFDHLNEKSLIEKIKQSDKKEWKEQDCRDRAEEFSGENFRRSITELVAKVLR